MGRVTQLQPWEWKEEQITSGHSWSKTNTCVRDQSICQDVQHHHTGAASLRSSLTHVSPRAHRIIVLHVPAGLLTCGGNICSRTLLHKLEIIVWNLPLLSVYFRECKEENTKLQWDKVPSTPGRSVNLFGSVSNWTLTSFPSALQFPVPLLVGGRKARSSLPAHFLSFSSVLPLFSSLCGGAALAKHFSEALLLTQHLPHLENSNLTLTSQECGSMCAYVLHSRGTSTPPSTTSSHAGMCTISPNDQATTFLSCFTQYLIYTTYVCWRRAAADSSQNSWTLQRNEDGWTRPAAGCQSELESVTVQVLHVAHAWCNNANPQLSLEESH